MDFEGAFDHVSRARLAQRMARLGIDDNLIGWTQSFLTNRWVELVIDQSRAEIQRERSMGCHGGICTGVRYC